MKALVYQEPEAFSVREIPIPRVGRNQVLIRVKTCGIRKTDVHIHSGHFISRFPLAPGTSFQA